MIRSSGSSGESASSLAVRLVELLSKATEELVRLAESQHLEFKSSARWNVQRRDKDSAIEALIVRAVAGFMNSRGGVLLIGVGDEGRPLGLESDYKTLTRSRAPRDAFENWLTTLLSNVLGHAATATCATILFDSVDGRDVCRVEVLPSPEPVFAEIKQSQTQLFVRINNSTRELNLKDSLDYVRRHWAAPIPESKGQVEAAVQALDAAAERSNAIQVEVPADYGTKSGPPTVEEASLAARLRRQGLDWDSIARVLGRRKSAYVALRTAVRAVDPIASPAVGAASPSYRLHRKAPPEPESRKTSRQDLRRVGSDRGGPMVERQFHQSMVEVYNRAKREARSGLHGHPVHPDGLRRWRLGDRKEAAAFRCRFRWVRRAVEASPARPQCGEPRTAAGVLIALFGRGASHSQGTPQELWLRAVLTICEAQADACGASITFSMIPRRLGQYAREGVELTSRNVSF
jgi:hypothetical protein